MGADPKTGELYTPEQREELDEEANARLVDVTEAEYGRLRDMTVDERLRYLHSNPGKDRRSSRRPKLSKSAKAKRKRAAHRATRKARSAGKAE